MSYRVDVRRLTIRARAGGGSGDVAGGSRDADGSARASSALVDVSFSVEPGRICGLFGGESSARSQLLACLAAYRRPRAGAVRVDGEDPYENARLMNGICLVDGRGGIGVDESTTVREVLEIVALLRPRWDQAFAAALLDGFEVAAGAKVARLARGRRAALAVTIALASRAPLTMIDEAHLDLEPTDQVTFHRALRADQQAHRRTVILAGPTVGEAGDDDIQRAQDGGGPLDDVVLLGGGRLLAAMPAVGLRARGHVVSGDADALAAFLATVTGADVPEPVTGAAVREPATGAEVPEAGATPGALGDALTGGGFAVLADRRLGRLRSVVLVGALPRDAVAAADRARITVGPVGLRELVTRLTDERAALGDLAESSR
jgi:ABC-2 type transport system ATP-binding protein